MLHVSYYILILVIMCVCIYLLIFVYICFAWLCATWLPFCYMMHAWLLCSFMTLTYWLYRLILLAIIAYWLFLLYDYPIHFDMCILIISCLIHLDGCILSWSSLSMLSLLYIHLDYIVFCFLFNLCVDMDDIYALCMTVCCMTSLLLHDACIACLYGTHIYPLTSNSLVSIDLNYSMVEISREIVIEYQDLSYCTWL